MNHPFDNLQRWRSSADGQSTVLIVVAVTMAAFLSIGVLARGDRRHVLVGSVISVGATTRVPAAINRWCLPGPRHSPDTVAGNVAIVAFGEGRSRHLYAYPIPTASGLSANDKVWSDIETCAIRRIDERVTLGEFDASTRR